MITKKQKLITLMVVACSASAIAFFVYKGRKYYKLVKETEVDGAELMKQAELDKNIRDAKELIEVNKVEEDFFKYAFEFEEDEPDDEWIDPEDMQESSIQLPEVMDVEHQTFVEEYDKERAEAEEEYVDEEDEVEVLQYPINSREAMNQYINMSLANILDKENNDTLRMLFGFDFNPRNELDVRVANNMLEERYQFFSHESTYSNKVTIAELVLYYANLAMFDLGESMDYWVAFILANIGIKSTMGPMYVERIIDTLIEHRHVVQDGVYADNKEHFNLTKHGIFALDSEQIQQAHMATSMLGDTYGFIDEYNQFVIAEMEKIDDDYED